MPRRHAPLWRSCKFLLRIFAAGLALFALLWPDVAALAETTTGAVVTNINGLLTVRSSNGASHQVTSFQPVRNGDTLLTGLDSLSVLRLEGAGRVRLGAGTSAVVLATAPSLGLRLTSGLMCASADAPKLTISAGDFTLSAAAAICTVLGGIDAGLPK